MGWEKWERYSLINFISLLFITQSHETAFVLCTVEHLQHMAFVRSYTLTYIELTGKKL